MKPWVPWVAAAAGALLTGLLGWLGASGRLGSARATELDAIGVYSGFLERVRTERLERPALVAKIKSVVDRTLGPSAEAVDSGLRGRLNRIGEEIGLADLAVSTEADKERVATPAKAEFRSSAEKKLRDEPDFVEVRGSISGEGTLDQALRLVHRIDVEPWIKRLDQIRLDPGKTGERVRVLVKMTTLFIEGAVGPPVPPPSAEAIAGFAKFAPFVQRNPFRVPPPAAPPPPPVVQRPPDGPPPFPWKQWKLTALLDGPLGPEAHLRNTATQATATLTPGSKLGEAEFVGYAEEIAVFRVGEALFHIALGATLDRRSPVPAPGS